MKSKRIAAITILSLTASCALAQTGKSFVISGQLTDSVSGAGDAYSTVRLLAEGKKEPVAVTTTDGKGQFRLSYSAPGKYVLETAALGRESVRRNVTLSTDNAVNLGKIYTYESTSTLGEATVMGVKQLVKAEVDRLSYSMGEDPDAKSSTMLDMLRKVPLVTVDGEDNIAINGNSSFKVYVNGKPNKMMSDNPSVVLKSFPASVVKKVEVITDPGAKYDAEGISGILNIVTSTETETSGWTATPSLKIGNKESEGSLFVMAQYGKFTISAHGGLQHQSNMDTRVETSREFLTDPTNHLLRGTTHGRPHSTFGFGGLDASYEFSPHDLLTASTSFFAGQQKSHGDLTNQMTGDHGTVYSYAGENRSKTKFNNIDASVDYQHLFNKEEQSLTLSYRVSNSLRNNITESEYHDILDVPFTLNDLYVDPENKSQEHTAQADFTTPIGEHHTLSAGVKYIYRLNKSDSEEKSRPAGTDDDFVKDEEQSLRYRHRNDITAGYLEYMYKLKKFSLRAGLRFESSHIRVTYPDKKREAFSTTLNDWVPSLNLAYNITETQMLRAVYNIRIGRPGINYLSPYVNHTDPTNISYGDPNLSSERAHKFGLSYNLFTQKFTFVLETNYSVSTNGLTNYTFVRDGILNTTSSNSLHSKVLTVSSVVNWAVVKGTSLMFQGMVSYGDYKSYRTGDHNHGYTGSIFAMVRQELPWKLKMNIGGGNQWGAVSLQGSSHSFYYYFGSLSRSFLAEDRLTVSLSTFSPFNSKRKLTTTASSSAFRSQTDVHLTGMARVSLGISWRLGKLKANVKKSTRTIENDDVQGGNSQSQGGMSGVSTNVQQ